MIYIPLLKKKLIKQENKFINLPTYLINPNLQRVTMKNILLSLTIMASTLLSFSTIAKEPVFNIKNDLLLLNFDLKTDVDDVHTIAALNLILRSPTYKNLNYFAVAGTYGVQGGLYVPANTLFDMVFFKNWTDAHGARTKAITQTTEKIKATLDSGGNIWIAEAGQSDYTQTLLKALKSENIAVAKNNIIVVQHSEWNEKETSHDALLYVKENTTYIKIPDGNKAGNGSAGFNEETFVTTSLENKKLLSSPVWIEANKISTQYNGINGRYNNKAISNGGIDFSDLSEVIRILDIKNTPDVTTFFNKFNKEK